MRSPGKRMHGGGKRRMSSYNRSVYKEVLIWLTPCMCVSCFSAGGHSCKALLPCLLSPRPLCLHYLAPALPISAAPYHPVPAPHACTMPPHTAPAPCRATKHLAVPYGAMPCHAGPCRAVPCCAVPRRTMPHRALPCCAAPYHAVSCRAMLCRAVPCHN